MRLIVGVSGASGVIMGYYLLKALKQYENCETHLVLTEGARKTWKLETAIPVEALETMADFNHSDLNMAAPISSGSFQTEGMIVIPCSMKTLSGIATGYAANLLVRAVDVCLKEHRRVVIVPREMPLGKIHLRNLQAAAEWGCTVIPPSLTFYNKPQSMDDQINHIIGKILMQFGLDYHCFVPWKGEIDDQSLR